MENFQNSFSNGQILIGIFCTCMTIPFKKYLLWNDISKIKFLKDLIWFRATSKITEESIKPDKTELGKDYDTATQNDQNGEEVYDPVSCE